MFNPEFVDNAARSETSAVSVDVCSAESSSALDRETHVLPLPCPHRRRDLIRVAERGGMGAIWLSGAAIACFVAFTTTTLG